MRTQRRVFEKLSETTKVELASEKIELGLIDDVKKAIQKIKDNNKNIINEVKLTQKAEQNYEKLHTKWFNTYNCEWCNKDVSKRRYIEHNHYSGEVRGIVCQSCNNKIATKDKRYKEVMISIKSIKT